MAPAATWACAACCRCTSLSEPTLISSTPPAMHMRRRARPQIWTAPATPVPLPPPSQVNHSYGCCSDFDSAGVAASIDTEADVDGPEFEAASDARCASNCPGATNGLNRCRAAAVN